MIIFINQMNRLQNMCSMKPNQNLDAWELLTETLERSDAVFCNRSKYWFNTWGMYYTYMMLWSQRWNIYFCELELQKSVCHIGVTVGPSHPAQFCLWVRCSFEGTPGYLIKGTKSHVSLLGTWMQCVELFKKGEHLCHRSQLNTGTFFCNECSIYVPRLDSNWL